MFCVEGCVSAGTMFCHLVSICLQTSAQQALMGTINTSMHAVQQAQDDLSELDSLPPLGQDMVNIILDFHSMSLPWQKAG